jgi:GNAT superfamily N-acetyltransferase
MLSVSEPTEACCLPAFDKLSLRWNIELWIMNITIRFANANDASQLSMLLHDIGWFSTIQNETETETTTRLQTQLASINPESYTLVVAETDAGQIVGYTAVHWLPYLILSGAEGYVSELFVTEAARGMGVGRRLLTAVKQEAVQRGCCRLQLLNMRNRESYQRRFYEKDGWRERENAANFVYSIEDR